MRMGLILLGGCVLLAAGCGSTKHAAPPPPKPTPPVIHETGSPLPCPKKHPYSTIAMEGCADRSIAQIDRQINTQAAAIFRRLPASYRRGFVQSEQSWLAYRNGTCEAQSGKYAGGTGAPVIAVYCLADVNREHLHDLNLFRKFLELH